MRFGKLQSPIATGDRLFEENGTLFTLPKTHFYRVGSYHTANVTQAGFSATAMLANTLRAWPWIITRRVSFNEVRADVSAAVASTQIRFGIYADNNVFPGALVAGSDGGTIDSSTIGVKSIGLGTIVLVPGLYWLASLTNGTPGVRSIPVIAINSVMGLNAAGGSNPGYSNYSIAQAFGVMPANFSITAVAQANNACPGAFWRVV